MCKGAAIGGNPSNPLGVWYQREWLLCRQVDFVPAAPASLGESDKGSQQIRPPIVAIQTPRAGARTGCRQPTRGSRD